METGEFFLDEVREAMRFERVGDEIKAKQIEMEIYEYFQEKDEVLGMSVLNYFDPELSDHDNCSGFVATLEDDREKYERMLNGEEEWDRSDPVDMIDRINKWLRFFSER
ncbi:MAG: hypothetical protein Q8Q94_00855 [bacterium]|nr:hypothetical protein [bacterium]